MRCKQMFEEGFEVFVCYEVFLGLGNQVEQTAFGVLILHVGILPKLLKASFSQFISLVSCRMRLLDPCGEHVFEYTRDLDNLLEEWFELSDRPLLKNLVDCILNGLKLRGRWRTSPLEIKLRYQFRLPLHCLRILLRLLLHLCWLVI